MQANLALIDAGIPLRDFVCCCHAGYIGNTAIIDLNYAEVSISSNMFPRTDALYAHLPVTQSVAHCMSRGSELVMPYRIAPEYWIRILGHRCCIVLHSSKLYVQAEISIHPLTHAHPELWSLTLRVSVGRSIHCTSQSLASAV